ncbi:MAG TPA: carboxypeptidase-like regulatory domain-containing protein [Candidatus Sulfotelmatobacter sp.]|nr:carboxypeptidase-like regulatory domain-containing protein [Candidatus Sulfotelmatobacter sp.]
MNLRLRVFSAGLAFLLIATLSVAATQQDKEAAKHEASLKSVRGLVSDKSENPIPSSVVFLKNTRSNAIRSYISDDAGNYRFSGLDPNVDYEIHAEKDGAKSQTRTISSFDSKKEIVLNLKIDKKKG